MRPLGPIDERAVPLAVLFIDLALCTPDEEADVMRKIMALGTIDPAQTIAAIGMTAAALLDGIAAIFVQGGKPITGRELWRDYQHHVATGESLLFGPKANGDE